jgi:hypothetical protein
LSTVRPTGWSTDSPAENQGRPKTDEGSFEQLELFELKQECARESGNRYYGDGGTLHGTTHLDVELDAVTGEVRAVWFRCQQLPFKTSCTTGKETLNPKIGIVGVEVKEQEAHPEGD